MSGASGAPRPGDHARIDGSPKVHALIKDPSGDYLRSVCGMVNFAWAAHKHRVQLTDARVSCRRCLRIGVHASGFGQVSFNCPRDLRSKLDRAAAQLGLGRPALIRRILADAFAANDGSDGVRVTDRLRAELIAAIDRLGS